MTKSKLCKYFPTHLYVGAVVCYGFVQDGMIIANQCKNIENCLKKVYKYNPEILEIRLEEVKKTREKINEVKDVQ